MSDTLVGATTVVSEIRQYTVNKKGRKRLNYATAAARSEQIQETTIKVTKDNPYVIHKHANKHLTIKSEHPVRLVLRQQAAEQEDVPVHEPIYETAVLYCSEAPELNSDFVLTVKDKDAITASTITVMNVDTGETEEVIMELVAKGILKGTLRLVASATPGPDFSGCMYVDYDHRLLVIYDDSRSVSGMPVTVEKTVRVEAHPEMPEMIVRRAANSNTVVGIEVTNSNAVWATVKRGELTSTVHFLNGDFSRKTASFLMLDAVDAVVILESTDTLGRPHRIERTVAFGLNVQGTVAVSPTVIEVDDPKLNGNTLNVIVLNLETEEFERTRLTLVAEHTGRYRGIWFPQVAGDYEVRYFDQGVMRTATITIAESVTPEEPELPEEPGVTPNLNGTVELEAHGLFMLNGRFSGVIEIYSVADEVVHCSVLHAS